MIIREKDGIVDEKYRPDSEDNLYLDMLGTLLNKLRIRDPRSHEVIQRHFLRGQTLKEIGKIYGLRPQSVSAIRDRGIRRLSQYARLEGINDPRASPLFGNFDRENPAWTRSAVEKSFEEYSGHGKQGGKPAIIEVIDRIMEMRRSRKRYIQGRS